MLPAVFWKFCSSRRPGEKVGSQDARSGHQFTRVAPDSPTIPLSALPGDHATALREAFLAIDREVVTEKGQELLNQIARDGACFFVVQKGTNSFSHGSTRPSRDHLPTGDSAELEEGELEGLKADVGAVGGIASMPCAKPVRPWFGAPHSCTSLAPLDVPKYDG